MEERSICPLPMAKADTENYINSIPKISSVSDADTVINTYNINSSQLKGDLGEDQTLKGLLTDDHCHVCDAVLLFESQRVSHYEGKKHAQKLRLYLQVKKDEKRNKDSNGSQRCITMDKKRFCELCNMVFSSPVVARSHYRGKVHAKNLRKQGLNPTANPSGASNQNVAQTSLPLPTQAPSTAGPQMSEEGNEDSDPDPYTPADVDLSDPNKHCRLCAASFNNPHMALQHYNGRKHQRNHSRQQLLQDLGNDRVQENCLTCLICSIELNSVEMYQAHMQGNKHQIREKKVLDLCKSQKKAYSSFTDELADYVQVQKARGLAPKTNVGSTRGKGQTKGEEQEEEEDGRGRGNSTQSKSPEPSAKTPYLPLSLHPLCPPHPTAFYPPTGWRPHYQVAPTDRNSHGWGPTFPHLPPQPLVPGLTSLRLHGHPSARKRAREHSSSSSSYTSSSPSSYTSSSSDSSTSYSDSSEHGERRRGRGKSRKERRWRVRDEEEERRRRKRGMQIRDDSEGRKGRGNEAEEERGRKSRKRQSKSSRHGEGQSVKRRREDSGEGDGGGNVKKQEIVEENVGSAEQTLFHMQSETKESSEEKEQNKPKHRKDKRKMKEKVDTRTEEEKLWDESILGL
ncbi:zinc finger matrin-type protein 1 [Osmerus mordax]|uniref:zinc finger matrin-type protein 1 n=1 Tax=Osmerus mordax TaxID=8014 RepID=UPI00350F9F9C